MYYMFSADVLFFFLNIFIHGWLNYAVEFMDTEGWLYSFEILIWKCIL